MRLSTICRLPFTREQCEDGVVDPSTLEPEALAMEAFLTHSETKHEAHGRRISRIDGSCDSMYSHRRE
jgi:hypothetical protein